MTNTQILVYKYSNVPIPLRHPIKHNCFPKNIIPMNDFTKLFYYFHSEDLSSSYSGNSNLSKSGTLYKLR